MNQLFDAGYEFFMADECHFNPNKYHSTHWMLKSDKIMKTTRFTSSPSIVVCSVISMNDGQIILDTMSDLGSVDFYNRLRSTQEENQKLEVYRSIQQNGYAFFNEAEEEPSCFHDAWEY